MMPRSLTFAVAFALCGCANWHASAPSAEAPIQERLISGDLQVVLGYAERVRMFSPSVLAREYARVERGYSEHTHPADRVKLAMLLSLRHATFRDEARARGLLQQAVADTGYNAAEYRALAELLLVALDERRELERSFEEERRLRIELSKKLQQLKAIEEEIDRRTTAP